MLIKVYNFNFKSAALTLIEAQSHLVEELCTGMYYHFIWPPAGGAQCRLAAVPVVTSSFPEKQFGYCSTQVHDAQSISS